MGQVSISGRGWLPGLVLCVLVGLLPPVVTASTVSALDVTVTSGATGLPGGATPVLKIYGAGPLPRTLTLPVDGAWPAGATRVVHLVLERPLDPATVRRFALGLEPGHGAAAPWDIESFVVEWQGERGRERLLAATLSGMVGPGRDLASPERHEAELRCQSDADCSDGLDCNGRERCAPAALGADARGCLAGRPPVCPVNQVCVEHRGCRGVPAGAGTASPVTTPSR